MEMDTKQQKERRERLKAIRREIGVLLDEALLLADDLLSDRQWIEAFWDVLTELDTRDAPGSRSDQPSD
jgi:hypothetical protein